MTVTTSRPTSRFHWCPPQPAGSSVSSPRCRCCPPLAAAAPHHQSAARVSSTTTSSTSRTPASRGVRAGTARRALAARKRIAWLDPRVLHGRGGGVERRRPAHRQGVAAVDVGEVIGLVFHVASIGFLLLPIGNSGQGSSRRVAQGSGHPGCRMAIGTFVGWGLLEFFPGSLAREDRFWYALNRVGAFAGAGADCLHRAPARLRQRAARLVRRAGSHGGGSRVVPVPARRERTDR